MGFFRRTKPDYSNLGIQLFRLLTEDETGWALEDNDRELRNTRSSIYIRPVRNEYGVPTGRLKIFHYGNRIDQNLTDDDDEKRLSKQVVISLGRIIFLRQEKEKREARLRGDLIAAALAGKPMPSETFSQKAIELAKAVLVHGDLTAAYALADKLMEDRAENTKPSD